MPRNWFNFVFKILRLYPKKKVKMRDIFEMCTHELTCIDWFIHGVGRLTERLSRIFISDKEKNCSWKLSKSC